MVICGMQIKDAISFYHDNKSIDEIDARNAIVTKAVGGFAWAISITCFCCTVWLNIMVFNIQDL